MSSAMEVALKCVVMLAILENVFAATTESPELCIQRLVTKFGRGTSGCGSIDTKFEQYNDRDTHSEACW